MKLKTIKVQVDGKELDVAVIDDKGLPVYTMDDGSEVGYDVAYNANELKRLASQSAGRQKDIDRLTEQLKVFDGIEPEKARKALEVVANLDAGKLLDAGKVDDLKKQVGQAYEASMAELRKAHDEAQATGTKKVEELEASIRRLLIKGAFESSRFIKDETVLPPEIAYTYFGNCFEVQPGGANDFQVVAKIDGQPVFSKARPGQLADPEEAIVAIINQYKFKDTILKASRAGGSGAPPGGSQGAVGKTTIQQLQEQHAAATKAGDFPLAMRLKKDIHDAMLAGGQ